MENKGKLILYVFCTNNLLAEKLLISHLLITPAMPTDMSQVDVALFPYFQHFLT